MLLVPALAIQRHEALVHELLADLVAGLGRIQSLPHAQLQLVEDMVNMIIQRVPFDLCSPPAGATPLRSSPRFRPVSPAIDLSEQQELHPQNHRVERVFDGDQETCTGQFKSECCVSFADSLSSPPCLCPRPACSASSPPTSSSILVVLGSRALMTPMRQSCPGPLPAPPWFKRKLDKQIRTGLTVSKP